jgi:Flp pilus assembly protein CpaB
MATGGRRSGRILIIIAVVLVVILGVVAFLFRDPLMAQFNPPAPAQAVTAPAVETVDIVILVQPVPMGGIITKDMVTLFPYPKDKAPEGFFYNDVNAVIGKRARLPLQASIALTTGYLSDAPIGSFVSAQIPPGYVAISIPIDVLSAVSWALMPGDHVSVLAALAVVDLDPGFQTELPNNTGDVQAFCLDKDGNPLTNKITGEPILCQKTIKISPNAIGRTELEPTINQPVYVVPSEPLQRPRIISQMLISDATVLGLGDMKAIIKAASEGTNPAPAPTPVPGAAPTPPPVITPLDQMITLVVSPQDAVTLNYVMLNKGAKLNLVLRSAQDTAQTKTEAVTLQFLMDQYNIPLPSKLPFGLEPRVDNLDLNSSAATPAPK